MVRILALRCLCRPKSQGDETGEEPGSWGEMKGGLCRRTGEGGKRGERWRCWGGFTDLPSPAAVRSLNRDREFYVWIGVSWRGKRQTSLFVTIVQSLEYSTGFHVCRPCSPYLPHSSPPSSLVHHQLRRLDRGLNRPGKAQGKKIVVFRYQFTCDRTPFSRLSPRLPFLNFFFF